MIGAGIFAALGPAAAAAAGALLSLLAGISRTVLAVARRRELPRFLDAVHRVHGTPHRAEVAAAVLVASIVAVADVRQAIGFSSFCVLTYYGLANASAWTLPTVGRGPRAVAAAGAGLASSWRRHCPPPPSPSAQRSGPPAAPGVVADPVQARDPLARNSSSRRRR